MMMRTTKMGCFYQAEPDGPLWNSPGLEGCLQRPLNFLVVKHFPCPTQVKPEEVNELQDYSANFF